MKFHLFNFKPNGLIRAAWHLRAGHELCGSISRLQQFVPVSINSMTTANNFAKVTKNLPPAKTILDVGANVSQMTKLLLQCLPDGVKVFSFEPNPELKPIGKVFNMALADRDGETTFYLPPDSTWGTIVASKAQDWQNKELKTKLRRFESLLASGEIKLEEMPRPILLKVDTEGCEFQTLSGFGDFLKQVDYIMIEVTNPHIVDASSDAGRIFSLLLQQGFDKSKVLYAGHDGSSLPDYLDVFFWKTGK